MTALIAPQIERPWAIKIPYFDITLYEEDEDPDKHFTMKELKAQTREELLALAPEATADLSCVGPIQDESVERLEKLAQDFGLISENETEHILRGVA